LNRVKYNLTGHNGWIKSLSVHGKRIVTGSYDDTVKIWDAEQGVNLCTLQHHQYGVQAVTCDSSRLVSGNSFGSIAIHDFSKQARVLK